MKKSISVLALAALSASVLAACGGNKAETAAQTTAAASTEAAEKASEEGTKAEEAA